MRIIFTALNWIYNFWASDKVEQQIWILLVDMRQELSTLEILDCLGFKDTDGDVLSSIYVALNRLEKKGLIVSQLRGKTLKWVKKTQNP